MASVLMGFMLGYIVFGSGGNMLAYAEGGLAYQPAPPYVAAPQYEAHMAMAENHDTPHAHPPAEDEPSHLFVITTLDGFLVVYHAEEYGGGIKEVTNTFVGALAPEELERLEQGIRIYSAEALAKILQDYGS